MAQEEEERVKIIFDTNAKQAAGDTNKLGKSIDDATTAVNENNDAVEKGNATYKTFKTQLREANQELQKQIQLTGESSQETIKAAKAVADLKDQMGFAADLSESFNPDQKMKALGAATRVAATGVQGVTAGMALFGDQSEDTQKTLLKVQAAMAFSDAISGLSELGDQWQLLKNTINASSLATKANAAATGVAAMVQNVFTGSVETTTTGFKALKFAIAATGIGLLVVGLAAVIMNFEKISEWAGKSSGSMKDWAKNNQFLWKTLNVLLAGLPYLIANFKEVSKSIGDIVNSVTDFVGITSEADRAIDKQKDRYDKLIKQNERYLERNASTISDARKREIELSNEHFKRVSEGRFTELESHKIFEEAKIKDAREAQEKRDKLAKEAADRLKKEQEEAAKKRREDAIKEKEEYIKQANDFEEQQAEIKKNQEQKAREDAEKKYEEELQALADKAKVESEIADNLAVEKKRREDVIFQQEEAIQNAKLSLAQQGVNLFGQIFGKSKKAQKAALIASNAVGLAEVVINTQKAVSADIAVPFGAGLPKVPIDIASGALGAASIIAATATGLKELGGGSAGQQPNMARAAGVSQAIPTVAFNNTAENQIGQSVNKAQAENPPLKVYVAESDISDAQNNVKVLVDKNTF